jgi:hypothetical protein
VVVTIKNQAATSSTNLNNFIMVLVGNKLQQVDNCRQLVVCYPQ